MQKQISAFLGQKLLITASITEVATYLKTQVTTDEPILIFQDQTGKQIDLDLTGTVQDVADRYAEEMPTKKVGRPKLGVISREITLQQKHWDWLDLQSSSASAVLRKLIDHEMKNHASEYNIMLAKQATDRFMAAILGNEGHFEEATRALYQDNKAKFIKLIADFPEDLKAHVLLLSQNAFVE
ncbi:DUF2239 family protein [Acinetobacter gerneri]|uniref:DUF2239 family protein n=1 Tax=Acinetobacter gerneri TaxID=202952 RepID=UPI0028A76AA0|nr:DUF2239 family protein [Acinetobacter gerneri]